MQVLRTFAARGARVQHKRWRSVWGFDLVTMDDGVLGASPFVGNPFAGASELKVAGRDTALVSGANGLRQAMEQQCAGSAIVLVS